MDSVELGGFLISKIIKWEDLKGLHGFATGNTKKNSKCVGEIGMYRIPAVLHTLKNLP